MKKAIILLTLTLCAVPGLAQQGAAKAAKQAKSKQAAPLPADAPSREEVLKLFEMLQISKTMEIAIQAAKQQSFEMAEQMIEERAPDATPEQKKQMREMIDEIMGQALGPAAIKEMLEATVPVYQRHLSKNDLQAMMAFYSSPVGQKVLREQPAMVQESMQAASGIQQRIARSIYMKIDERMEKMMESGKEEKKP
ncbi:MAG TPA: DUF2059 domain-containing protein [Candidatus Angelobacter sp.]|nr:DUF2059 domain-containing protein [Candidatus Angelobacter sp.]